MTQNPFTAVFDAQRTAIEQSQQLTRDALEAQKTSFGVFGNALVSSGQLLEGNAELSKGAFNASLDALESSLPEDAAEFDEVRELVDEGVDAAVDTQAQTLETLADALEESEVAYDEFADGYADLVDSSFEAYLDAHEQLQANVDDAVSNAQSAADEFDASA